MYETCLCCELVILNFQLITQELYMMLLMLAKLTLFLYQLIQKRNYMLRISGKGKILTSAQSRVRSSSGNMYILVVFLEGVPY